MRTTSIIKRIFTMFCCGLSAISIIPNASQIQIMSAKQITQQAVSMTGNGMYATLENITGKSRRHD